MKINYISVIGLLAGTLTTLSFLPQVVKTARTKETKDLSLSMYIVLATGIFLWTIYGILIGAIPVILANGISFILATIVLIFKIKYG
jgi:MtN3 and saliva related transmembrane protein